MRLKALSICALLALVLSAVPLRAQQNVLIRDILDNPQKFYNLTVQIKGDVIDVRTPATTAERGFYTVIDNSDKTLRIFSANLPAPNEKVKVSGVVQVDPGDQVPYLREMSRSAGTIFSPLVIGLIALIALIILAILFVAFRKPKAQAPALAAAPIAKTAPAPGASDPTRQVSLREVEKQVGGMKTKQVPSLLAEIRIMSGDKAGKSYPLGFETVIGRVMGDILLEDASVSKEHAKIVFLGTKYAIENLSQTNPAILNGEKVMSQKELKPGDEIIFGLVKTQFRLI